MLIHVCVRVRKCVYGVCVCAGRHSQTSCPSAEASTLLFMTALKYGLLSRAKVMARAEGRLAPCMQRKGSRWCVCVWLGTRSAGTLGRSSTVCLRCCWCKQQGILPPQLPHRQSIRAACMCLLEKLVCHLLVDERSVLSPAAAHPWAAQALSRQDCAGTGKACFGSGEPGSPCAAAHEVLTPMLDAEHCCCCHQTLGTSSYCPLPPVPLSGPGPRVPAAAAAHASWLARTLRGSSLHTHALD